MFYSINSASTSIQRRQVGIRRKNSREFISMGLFAIVFSLLVFTGVRSSYHRRFKYIPFYPLEEQLLFRLPEIDTEAYGGDTDDDSESGFSGEELVEVKKEVQSLTDLVDGFLKELDPDSEKTSSPKKPDIPKCPSGFEYLEQSRSCYKVIFERYDRDSASRQCKHLDSNSHLVSITTRKENDALKNYLKRKSSRSSAESHCRRHGWPYPETAFWTSAQRVNASDCSSHFAWKDRTGDETPFAFTNWSVGEPNCYHDDEGCVEIIPHHGSTWNDVACQVESCPICEFDPE